jgi:pimeloyl-[acyl-carrier protein] methyl ester esterase
MTQTLRTVTSGKGPELVLLHGWGLNSGVWESLMPSLTPRFTVTLIDLPGFGLNHDIVPESYNLSSIAELILNVMPAKATLTGWSLGGLMAQHIASSRPDKIDRLILLCTSPKFMATEEWPGIAEPVLREFHQQLKHDFSKTLDRFLAIQAMGSQSAKADIRQLKQSISQYPPPHQQALSGGLSLLSDIDLRHNLTQITAPTTWFFGRLDSLVPQKMIQKLKLLQPLAKHIVIPKASHAPFVSHQEDFLDLLLNELHTK